MPTSAVAILIVNYKTYDELEAALTSVASTWRPGDEVVVFDQESDEASRLSLAARHPGVRWIGSPANVGFAAGINRAAAASTAPFLLWLNPDARLEPGAIDTLAAWMADRPHVAIAGPRVVNDDGSVQASARRFPSMTTALAGRSTWLSRRFPRNWLTRRNLLALSATEPVAVDWVAGSCLLTRRDVFERLGGLDEAFFMYWEDADYAKRAAALGFETMIVPAAVVRHTAGRSAAYRPRPSIRAFHASAYRMYRKHAGPIGRLVAPVARLALWIRGELHARRQGL